MNRSRMVFTILSILLTPALSTQTRNRFAGRWDITVTAQDATYPNWMELVEKDGELQVRVQPRGGAVRPAVAVKADGSRLFVAVSPASGNRLAVSWELELKGDRFTGAQKTGESVSGQLVGVRAPALKGAPPKAWTDPEPLFNGKDLTGWEPVGSASNFYWTVKDGELVNEQRGGNIKTTRTFDDFKLHIDFNCPERGNSGLYLRGRYEIQIGTEGGREPSREMGAIFGFFPASRDLPLRLGEWQSYDVTLIGRYVTVVRNGVTIHENQEIPGITGGALDSREAEPGPFYIQGDHSGGLRFRNITVSLPKR